MLWCATIDIQLKYTRNSFVGAKLYVNSSNYIVIKIENAPQLPEPNVVVMFQGDLYDSVSGTIFLITPTFKDMNSLGLGLCIKAYSEPLWGPSISTSLSGAMEMRSNAYHPIALATSRVRGKLYTCSNQCIICTNF